MLKKNNGITMTILALTVAVMIIVAGAIIVNASDVNEIKELTNMQNDITNLSNRINVYYAANKSLPVSTQIQSGEVAKIGDQANINDNGNYYQINLTLIDNINLNYGDLSAGADDMYIINEASHKIYYLKGVQSKGVTYYTIIDEDQNLSELEFSAPEDFEFTTSSTENTITITGTTTSTLGIQGYKFRISGGEWTDVQTSGTYTFTDLQSGIPYKVSMMAVDTAGNIKMATNNEQVVGTIATTELPTTTTE